MMRLQTVTSIESTYGCNDRTIVIETTSTSAVAPATSLTCSSRLHHHLSQCAPTIRTSITHSMHQPQPERFCTAHCWRLTPRRLKLWSGSGGLWHGST